MNDKVAAGNVAEPMPMYLVWDGQVELNAPRNKAWPHVIDYPSWQDYALVEHISGGVGGEGEIVLLRKDADSPPYYARTIKLDPGRRVMWKTYPGSGPGPGSFFGIVEFRLDDMPDKTRFSYQLVYEFLVPPQPDEELEQLREQQYASTATLLAKVLEKLKKQVELGA